MKQRTISALGVLATAALTLTACAGSAGQEGDATGEGFEYGASQEEVNEVIAELEPVTLDYQPAANSPSAVEAPSAIEFKEFVEERSNDQIEINLVYGRAIAGYEEIDDALNDGRLDLSFHVPVYNPSDYATYDALSTALQGLPVSPVAGEAIYNAVAEDIAWSTPALLEEYEAMGITPLTPMMGAGGYYSVCNSEGSAPSDWQGRQVRVANTSHLGVVDALGASPVSMEYVEVYEALQRGTIDCTFAQMMPSSAGGIFEVAPHLTYSSDDYSLSARTSPALLAGSSFKQLPLAYQQILFDAAAVSAGGWVADTVNGNHDAVTQAKEAGGTITPMNAETEKIIGESQEEQLQQIIDEGRLDADIVDRIAESAEKWTKVAEELGITETGDFEDMDEWWEDRSIDFHPLSQQVFEEAALEHRPE